MKRLIAAITAMFGLSAPASAAMQGTPPDPVEAFWSWFVENEERLFAMDSDADWAAMMQIFDELGPRLRKIDEGLTFEFGGGPIDGVREFVISAEGVKQLIPVVLRVQRAAPELPRWRFIAFRQRGTPGNLEWKGEIIPHDDVSVAIGSSEKPGMLDLIVFLPGKATRDQNDNISIMYLLLDNALGEFDVMTKVGFIDTATPDDARAENAVPLTDLPELFDALYAGLQRLTGQDRPSDN